MTDSREERRCDECGERWEDTGEIVCPFCGSTETHPVEDYTDEGSR